MKRLSCFILLAALMVSLSACPGITTPDGDSEKELTGTTTPIISSPSNVSENTEGPDAPSGSENAEEFSQKISIQIGSQTFHAVIDDNPTARIFIENLPLTLEMQDLNGNEKYYYFPEDLLSESVPVGEIEAGDLMLYGADCLVLFYESFTTPYSYTRLGKIEETGKLSDALGNGKITVVFKLEE